MQRNELIKHGNSVFRVLEIRDNSVLLVDCLHKSMPRWIEAATLEPFSVISENELSDIAGKNISDYDSLSRDHRRFVHEHFTLIAGILPFIGDTQKRSSMISAIATEKNISKQTIRHYLWLYLAFQDIAVLAPKQKQQSRPLTQDEKNIRWALNKYFYTRHKNTLTTAYTLMLKEKYCDSTGQLLPEYPTIHQFRYFYHKHRKMQTYYISRDGLKNYQRNHRPLLGNVQDFAPSVGVGMLDATICDIYLVDDVGNLVGRPILTACVDAYSSLCCGYTLSWEGGVYSLRNLMSNIITDKVAWCRKFGIAIQQEDWDCSQLPATLVTDMGCEYKSANFEQLAELGVTIINLPSFRPELKGVVEKFFDLIQNSYKKHLKGKGVIEPDFQERGVHDYRKDVCLTMFDFEKIILRCILYYNNQRIIENFPLTNEMIADGVLPLANHIWDWGKTQVGANLISIKIEDLMLTLLPRTTGKFSRYGLIINGLRYKNDQYTERYLSGGEATVAYNPDDTSSVWLFEDGIYRRFMLAERRFSGSNFSEVDLLKSAQKSHKNALRCTNLQAQIDLARHIETIANAHPRNENTNIKQIRQTRKHEQRKTHINPMKGDR